MTKILVVLSMFTALGASANLMSQYDVLMQECLAAGDSSDLLRACHNQTKSKLLTDFAALDRYLSCVDYGHTPRSIEYEASCLREL